MVTIAKAASFGLRTILAARNCSNGLPSLETLTKNSFSQTITFFSVVVSAGRSSPFSVSLIACPPATTEWTKTRRERVARKHRISFSRM
jgi:hypothetical protein